MRTQFILTLGVFLLALPACNVSIPNGLFGCGQPDDCPNGYFCWSSDNRCYDAEEPGCTPKSCDQIIGEFASLGIPVECGDLPDGCEGSIECGSCPSGTQCGANDQNFLCGCEEVTCATVEGGAECGIVPTRCGGAAEQIDCGGCFGQQVCDGNKCVCPVGVNCDQGCGNCADGEVCVDGECCAPEFPCSQNECSPPGGFDNGCGGKTECPPCSDDEQCVISSGDLVFQCLGDCTCEAQDVECGAANICGQATLCGSCQDNGFGDGFSCKSGKCVCKDAYEVNDTPAAAARICGGQATPTCMQEVWGVSIDGTIHQTTDMDYYRLDVLDARTLLVAELLIPDSDSQLYMAYICPNGESGIEDCTGSTASIDGYKFCVSEERTIGLARGCDSAGTSGVGQVIVGVQGKGLPGGCLTYDLNVFATNSLLFSL
ncbi:MAG: hypothetical protein WBG86_18510 [Polyangiales bacterium]